MQIAIDTQADSIEELALAANLIDDILTLRRKQGEASYLMPVESINGSAEPIELHPEQPRPPVPPVPDSIAPEVPAAPTVPSAASPVPPPPAPEVPAPPAPVPPPPSPPPAPPGLGAADGELDKAGNRWDPNIHSSTKTKTIDGLWKYKRGTGGKAQAAGTAAPAAAGTSTASATQPAAIASSSATTGQQTEIPMPPQAPVPPVPPAPTPPAPPPAPTAGAAAPAAAAPSPGVPTFRDVIKLLSSLEQAGKWSRERTGTVLQQFGFGADDLALLSKPDNSAVLAPFIAQVNAIVAAGGG